jgi:hypothetical protein
MTSQQEVENGSLVHHFTILMYPFRHSISGGFRESRVRSLEPRWCPWWSRLKSDGELESAIADTHFLVPYVRRLIHPETSWLPTSERGDQLEVARDLSRMPLTEFAAKLGKHETDNHVLRLTLSESVLREFRQLEFRVRDVSASICTHWIDVFVCPQNVGFLAWKVEFLGAGLDHAALREILYYLRIVHPVKPGWDLAKWTTSNRSGATPIEFHSRDLIDFLIQGMTSVGDELDCSLAGFLGQYGQVTRPDLYTATDCGQGYGQILHLYSCVALAGDERDAGDELFPTRADRWVYELATCTDVSDPTYEPHVSVVEQLMADNRIAIWRNWQGMALHDNVVFVGFLPSDAATGGSDVSNRSKDFILETLPHNVESDYFQLYVLVLFQRTWLSMTFGELIRKGPEVDRNWRDVKEIWSRFVQFENCYCYTEVSNKPQGIYLYQRFQRALGVPHLYVELKEQLKTLHDHFDAAVNRRINRLLNAVTVVALPITIAVQIYSPHLFDDLPGHWRGFGLLLNLFAYYIFHRRLDLAEVLGLA